MTRPLRLPFLVLCAALSHAAAARSQPALTGETVLVNAAGPRAVAAGGASAAFSDQIFDVPLQPAMLGESRDFELGISYERDRFPLAGSNSWSLGTVVPLHRLDRALPSIAILHRRLRARTSIEGTVLGVPRRLELAFATEATTLAAGRSFGTGPQARRGRGGAIGASLHVVESGGELRTSVVGALGDTTTTVVAGLDDLLFAGSVGLVGWWSRPLGKTSTLQLRGGAVWRRAGEESDALSASLKLTNLGPAGLELLGFDPRSVTRPVVASEVAVGTGARWRTPGLRLTVQGEVAQPVYAGAPDDVTWRWGAELRLFDRVSLRGGGFDDLRSRDLVAGAGVEVPLYRGWHLGFDLAYEPDRFPEADGDGAVVWGLRLHGPLPRGSTREEAPDPIDELLDEIDDWLDESSDGASGSDGGGM